MLIRINTVLEAIITTIILHNLYGRKYYPDFKTIVFVASDLVILQGINEGYLPKESAPVIYLIILAYCVWKFNSTFKSLIVNFILYILILGVTQMICMTGAYFIVQEMNMEIRILLMHILMIILCIVLYRKVHLDKISYFFQQKNVIIKVILVISAGLIVACVHLSNMMSKIYYAPYIFMCIAIAIICIMAASWQASRMKAKEKEAELKMYQLYGESFENLLLEIRMHQHEFNNHINAVFGMHFTCDTYEELVESQKEYSEQIISENRYEQLLVSGNSVLTGFLYGKFVEAEKKGINVSYEIKSTNLNVGMPNHKLIELIGNLINNAIEALEIVDNPKMHIEIQKGKEDTIIEVMNTGDKLSDEEVIKIFARGYSVKGKNRGLGLYNVKLMAKEYGFKIIFENKTINNENWISFKIMFKSTPG